MIHHSVAENRERTKQKRKTEAGKALQPKFTYVLLMFILTVGFFANFERLVLGSIEAKVSNYILTTILN